MFWLAGFFKLLSTMLGNFDYVSRITADAVKINATPDSQTWTESRIYGATVWALIVFGIAILLNFTDQPLVLLVIGSALSAMVMFIYSIPLIVLNRKALPADDPHQRLPARDPGLRGAVVRRLLGARADRLHPWLVGRRMTKVVRLRLLLAVVIWFALISVVKLVELLA